jgi:hypothetical protein
MRPQQQNRRMRGRNGGGINNNRKGPNPLTRSYESNGPDVKIRGSAQQIAEKYAQLARDAQGSGDRVMAENYLQHAEHYNRIIAAAQAQMPIQNMQSGRDMSTDDMDEDRDDYDSPGSQNAGNAEQPQPLSGGGTQSVNLGAAPQPVIEGTPAEVALNAEAGGDGSRSGDRHQPNGANGNDQEGGGHRRARRPRRGGERHRPELNGEAADAAAAGRTADEEANASAAADASDPALLDADN